MSELPGRARRGRLRIGVQITGFLIGLALLGWCANAALSERNRSQLERLLEATPGQVGLLLACSLATLVLNGLIFWLTLVPVRRLRAADVVAVSAIATFLNYLPFKLSVVARFLIHNRRDGVPVLTIGAWFGAVLVVVVTALGPLVAVSFWRQGIDLLWWVGAVVGLVVLGAVTVLMARVFAYERGLGRIQALSAPLRLKLLDRFLATEAFARMHAGFAMLSSPLAVAGTTGLRVLDVAVQATRFFIAAMIVGETLGWEAATLVACTYFVIGMASPFGMLGTREAGTAGLAAWLGMAGEVNLAVIVLLVTATEAVVNLGAAAIAVAWLRPDRLVGANRPVHTAGEPGTGPTTP